MKRAFSGAKQGLSTQNPELLNTFYDGIAELNCRYSQIQRNYTHENF